MDATTICPHKEDLNTDSSKNYRREEVNSFPEANDVALRVNPTLGLNPPPPPLPGVFLFDRPNQQQNSSYNLDKAPTESYSRCNDSNNLLFSQSSDQLSKALPYGQIERSKKYSKANMYQSTSSFLQSTQPLAPTVSEVTDSMLPPNSSIHHMQTLEPITFNSYEETLQPPEVKVYHQLHAISPNHYNVAHEPKLYHEMTPVSLTANHLHEEDLNYEQLNPAPITENPKEKNKTFEELKPVSTHLDNTQYCNSKLYQQLCQPPTRENSEYHLEDQKYQQMRPATVIDFEQSRNYTTQQSAQQQLLNIPESNYPITTKSKQSPTAQVLIRDSVINNTETSKKPASHVNSINYPSDTPTMNKYASPIGFKEDKPKVYLELRNPSIRSQLTKSSTHYNQYSGTIPKTSNPKVPTTLSTIPQSTPRTQNTPEFKLPGPYEFKLPQQNSPNKYRLPKILSHNEYCSPESIPRPGGKGVPRHIATPLGTQKSSSLLSSSSQMFNRNTPFNGIRSKVALSLPKTPLCYGDPAVSNKGSYHPNPIESSKSVEPSVNQASVSHYEKQKDISASSKNNLYSDSMSSHSKLREELLKPKIAIKNFENVTSEGGVDKNSPLKVNAAPRAGVDKDHITSREAADIRSSLKDHIESRKGEENGSPLKDLLVSREGPVKVSPLKDHIGSRIVDTEKSVHLKDHKAFREGIDKGPTFKDHVVSREAIDSSPVKNQIVWREDIEKSCHLKDEFCSRENKDISISLENHASSDGIDKRHPLNVGPKEKSDKRSPTNGNDLHTSAAKDQNITKMQFIQLDNSETKSNEDNLTNVNFRSTSNKSILNTINNLPSGKDLEEKTQNPELNIHQSTELNRPINKDEAGRSILKHVIDESQTRPVKSVEKIIIEENYESNIKKICQSNLYTQAIENDILNALNGVEFKTVSIHSEGEGKVLGNTSDEANNFIVRNNGIDKNSLDDKNSSMKQEFTSMGAKLEGSDSDEIKIKRKYTRRIVPEVERRKHTKRKASWGLDDIIAREKRRYKKRNVSSPTSFRVENSNSNLEKFSSIENLVEHQIKESFVKVERMGSNEYKFPELSESAPRIKRKYTRRKLKLKYVNEEMVFNNGYIKRKVGRPRKEDQEKRNILLVKRRVGRPRKEDLERRHILQVKRKVGRPRKEDLERRHVLLVKRKVGRPRKEDVERRNVLQVKRKPGRPRKENVEKRIFNSKSPTKVKHTFVDPLEEGLITDDEDEAVFLGFDMTDEEDETILGFELDSDEESENDLRSELSTKLEEPDCMTVECDPRSILQLDSGTETCSQCGQRFDSHVDLAAHMQWHSSQTPSHHSHSYVCSVCYRGFPTQLQLEKHVNWTHEGGKKFKCEKCPKMFTTKAYAKRHVQKFHGDDVKETTNIHQEEESIHLISETADKEEEMEATAETVQKEKDVKEEGSDENIKQERMKITTFYCGECTETFKTETQLKEHENKIHNKPLFQCEKCLRYFQKLCNLQRHKMSHIDDSASQDFPCAYCNEKFSSRESLHAHWPIHSEKKVYTCDICNSNFTAMNSLKRHRILHTGEKLFRCEICQRSFSLLSTLKTHLLIHTGTRKFECKLCGKSFNRKDVLNAHQWIHTGEKKFQCEICLRKFRWRHALRSHKLIYHSTEKPYVCQTCGKSFSHPDSFKKHAEVHAERVFYCQICLKSFSRAGTLRAHIATHTDLKPFFCDKCHKGFRSKSHLRNHFLVHTKAKPWLCKFCNRTFKDQIQLRRHKRIVHFKNIYKKVLSSVPEDSIAQENVEATAEVIEAGDESQVRNSFEEEYRVGNSFEEEYSDPSNHFISLPDESEFPKIEQNIVPPSVF